MFLESASESENNETDNFQEDLMQLLNELDSGETSIQYSCDNGHRFRFFETLYEAPENIWMCPLCRSSNIKIEKDNG